jgi:hypothetical protein
MAASVQLQLRVCRRERVQLLVGHGQPRLANQRIAAIVKRDVDLPSGRPPLMAVASAPPA